MGSLKSFIIDIPALKKGRSSFLGTTHSIQLPQVSYSPKSQISIKTRKIFSTLKSKLSPKTRSKKFDFKEKVNKLKSFSVETEIRHDCMYGLYRLRRKHELIRSMRTTIRSSLVKKKDFLADYKYFARLNGRDSIKKNSQLPSPKHFTPQLFSTTQAKRINLLSLRNQWIHKRLT